MLNATELHIHVKMVNMAHFHCVYVMYIIFIYLHVYVCATGAPVS